MIRSIILLKKQIGKVNHDKNRMAVKMWRLKHPDEARQRAKKWRKENRATCNARDRRRDACKLHATPKWANHEMINAIYKDAQRLTEKSGVSHHVDHIIPLQGDTVRGFHVEYNLQILTASENTSKSNKLYL